MIKYFNDSIIKIDSNGADTLVIKQIGCASTTYTATDNVFTIDTTGFAIGDYYLQYMLDDAVVATDRITLHQNLLTASEDYDPRSEAEKILDAIEAMLAGRATTQQRQISIDGQSIQYSSFSELIEWKNYFVRKVAEEKGLKRIDAQKFKLVRF